MRADNNWGDINEIEVKFIISKLSYGENIEILDVKSDDLNGLNDVSAIYIYASKNKDKYYIGQTNLITRRHKQHANERESGEYKYHKYFSGGSLFILYGLDISRNINYIEDRLIKFFWEMSLFNNFKILNKNNGNKTDYIQDEREEKDRKIITNILRELWNKEFITFDISFSKSSLESILFRNTPFFVLDEKQENIVETIISGKNDHETYIIKGSAGTGKTVLMNHLIASFIRDNKKKNNNDGTLLKIAVCLKGNMVKQTKQMFKSYESNLDNLEIKIDNWYNIVNNKEIFDYIIVDESQRLLQSNSNILPREHQDFLAKSKKNALDLLIEKSRKIVLFNDNHQKIRSSDIDPIEIDDKGNSNYNFKSPQNIYSAHLQTQYRINPGKTEYSNEYVTAIKDLLEIEKADDSFKTNLFRDTNFFQIIDSDSLFSDLQELKNYISNKKEIFPYKNSRVLAGYSRDTKRKEKEQNLDNKIKEWHEIDMNWNSKYQKWATEKDASGNYKFQNEVGTVHSSQGYDFDYIGVIIGKDLYYDGNKICVSKKDYKDKKGKANISDQEELSTYVKQCYYVLLTRGIYGIRVVIEDDRLRNHFLNEIENYKK